MYIVEMHAVFLEREVSAWLERPPVYSDYMFICFPWETLKTVNTTGPEGIRPHSEVTDRWLSH